MKHIVTALLLAALLFPTGVAAQRRKKSTKKAKKEVVKEEDPRIVQMLASTQQVVFIDSMVVDQGDVLAHLPLSADCGRLAARDGLGQYTNELGDYRLTAVKEQRDSLARLTVSQLVGTSWSAPTLAKGIDSGNNPYMMPDGTTLYFAQQGERSIGGYDLFVTRYDAATGTFLRPESLGMPFCSEANDYLYVIDETYRLGYFVTDRRQPAGKVCIYVFIPSESRKTYVPEAYTEAQLRSLAAIGCIADTWGDGRARREALTRLAEARLAATADAADAGNGGRSELEELRHRAAVLEKALLLARDHYARQREDKRQNLRDEILSGERELEQLQRDIRQKEKEARNAQYKNTKR